MRTLLLAAVFLTAFPPAPPRPESTASARFEVFRDVKQEYRWRLVAANGRAVAVSGEGYTRRDDCLRALKTVRELVPTAPVVDVPAPDQPAARPGPRS
jgi:uncharacterized protein YegP (UPF0339 family)